MVNPATKVRDERKIHSILQLIYDGKHARARGQLQKYQKNGALSSGDKIKFVELFAHAADYPRCVKLCGKEMTSEELHEASEEELVLQIMLSFYLHHLGARYVAHRIKNKWIQVLKERNLNPNKIWPNYLKLLFRFARWEDRYELAEKYARQALESYETGSRDWKIAQMDLCALLNYRNEFEEAANCVRQIRLWGPARGLPFQLLTERCEGDVYYYQGNYKKALEVYEKAFSLVHPHLNLIVVHVLQRQIGECLFQLGEKEKGRRIIEKSIDGFCKSVKIPHFALHSLSQLENIIGKEMSLDKRIAVRCHPVFSTAAFRHGKKYIPELHGFIPKFMVESVYKGENDTWMIKDGDIRPINYCRDIMSILGQAGSQTVYDLKSALIFKECKPVETISKIFQLALVALYGSGSLGVTSWGLIDNIYSEEDLNFVYGEERLKFLVHLLRENNHPVVRKKNILTLSSNEKVILLPMNRAYPERHLFLKANSVKFKVDKIVEVFRINQSSAYRWLKEWREKNFVKRINEEGDYVFC